jgi:[protein-PII] uridylyltransferase
MSASAAAAMQRWWSEAVEPATTLRQRLQQADQALVDAWRAGESVETLLRAHTFVIDQVLSACCAEVDLPLDTLALVATGGYGRGELFPHSDIDILILTTQPADTALAARIEALLSALWNLGLKLGHATRTPTECVDAAAADLTIATSLMDARLVQGQRAVFAQLRTALGAPALWPAAAFRAGKLAEAQARHARYNDTAYNLEPNLKEGPGGLRDLHTALWIAERQTGLRGMEALRDAGLLGPEEFEALHSARALIWRIRYGLHLIAKRAEDRLLFEHQRELARQFGLRDEHAQNLAVEQFMQGYFRAAMTVDRIAERVIKRLDEAQTRVARHQLDHEFYMVGGALDLRDAALFERDPAAIFRAFLALLDHPELSGFHSALLQRLDAVLPGLDHGFRGDAAVNAAFLAILRHPGNVPEALARMNRYGVLGRYLPAFGRVAGRMQYDLFHVYTVDQHTLFVLRNLYQFGAATEPSLARELYRRLRKPELLFLAGLFHDIAKGRGGDHSELGEHDARAFCAQLGLSETDTDLVAWLVRHHLDMSVTAQKQDITDPAVVQQFAERVADAERLDYLYLLTVADIRGTSPKLWNSWKDRLLADLHAATRLAFQRGLEHPVHAPERIAETQREAMAALRARGLREVAIERLWREFPPENFLRYRADQIVWHTRTILDAEPDEVPLVACRAAPGGGASEVFVHSPDRDGLFATITAVFDRMQLSVVEARIASSARGMALDSFQVLEADGGPMREGARAQELVDRLRLELSRAELSLRPSRRATTRAQKHFHVPTRVEFDPTDANARTPMELICSDRPGLLAHVAQALRAARVRVHEARIATFGERAEDFFVLTDENNQALDTQRQQALSAALLEALEPAREPHGAPPRHVDA